MTVQWRPIPGYEGRYDVSNFGDIRSHLGSGRFRDTTTSTKFLAWNKAGEYPRVKLVASGGSVHFFAIHQLVLLAFVGPCPTGHECAHLNGDHGDPRLTNLAWKTHRDNEADKATHGTSSAGEGNSRARLTTADVARIRQLPTSSRKSLMAELAISSRHYYAVRNGKRWTHV
jgi:hypothetical protein